MPMDLGTPCNPNTPITKKYNKVYTDVEAKIVKIIEILVYRKTVLYNPKSQKTGIKINLEIKIVEQ